MSVLDLAFKRMAMLSTLQNQFNQQNATFFGNNKRLGVLQSGKGGLPRGRGGLMRRGGARLPEKFTQYKKFVQEEMADTTKKKEEKPIVLVRVGTCSRERSPPCTFAGENLIGVLPWRKVRKISGCLV